MTDVEPRYPHDIGIVRPPNLSVAVPIVSIEPDDYPGAPGWLMEASDEATGEWKFREGEDGPVALLRITDPGTDLDVILAFDHADRNERDVVFAAARTGWLAVCDRHRFDELTELSEPEGVAYVSVRREDVHQFLTG